MASNHPNYLGAVCRQLAKKIGCSQVNITAFERREREGTISLNALNKVAQAMDCHLVYFFGTKGAFQEVIKNRARIVARRYIQRVGVSMELENQGLKPAQRKHQERELVNELSKTALKNYGIKMEFNTIKRVNLQCSTRLGALQRHHYQLSG